MNAATKIAVGPGYPSVLIETPCGNIFVQWVPDDGIVAICSKQGMGEKWYALTLIDNDGSLYHNREFTHPSL